MNGFDNMKEITILPADTYTVINKTILDDKDHKIISMLYQPIIGYSAVSLYETLVMDLDKSELISDELTHHHLISTMQLSLDEIVIAREKLEAVGLLKKSKESIIPFGPFLLISLTLLYFTHIDTNTILQLLRL